MEQRGLAAISVGESPTDTGGSPVLSKVATTGTAAALFGLTEWIEVKDWHLAMNDKPAWRFVSFEETMAETFPNKAHYWHNRPDMVKDTNLLFVRCRIYPGQAHKFHRHPKMEEILYILSGTAEQWVEREKRVMMAGDSLYLPANVVHGTYNIGKDDLDFLAVLSPAKSEGPGTVEMGEEEPWKSLRP